MNQHLQDILNLIQQSAHLSDEEKNALSKAAKNVDKELEIASFKLDRTEKVKRTTAILLEETIEELENKRKAVEAQNKELEIESCLERVRTVAMSMNKPDDMLNVCRVIAEQLELLKVKEIRNVQTAIFYKEKGTYMNYEYYAKHNKTFITETSYTNHQIHQDFADKMLKGNGEFIITHINGNEVKDWIAYQKTTNVFIDDYLNTASSLNYYWFSLGPVALGISTYVPLSEEEINLFKRFLKVFELSYRRYLDIEKAEAQARESQIQLALERVRARTMAMQKSDELSETVFILFQQFKQLGENPDQATIGIINEEEWVIEYWVTMYGNQTNRVYKFPISEPNVTNRIYEAWKEQKKSLVIELSGKELYDFANFRESMGGAAYNPEEKKRVINVAFFSKGIINVQSNESRSEESIRLLERFAGVFEQTYTRFLDLKKAEAQARESQIQLALERVRARSLAMHGSNELADVVTILNEQLQHLGLLMEKRSAAILILEEGKKDYTQWIASPLYDKAFSLETPYLDNRIQNDIWEARQNKTDYYSKGYSVEEKNELFRFFFNQPSFSILSEEEKKVILESAHYELALAFEKNSSLGIAGLTGNLLSNEEGEIVKRAAKVFEQAYIRFLDLKKAETQARESQIQLALERVRARTMAMHNSEDVTSAAETMFEELRKLGINCLRGGIANIRNDKTMDVFGITNMDGKTMSGFSFFDMNLHPIWQRLFESWKNKEEVVIGYLSGKEKENYLNIVNKRPNYLPQSIVEFPDTHFQAYHFDQGAIWTYSLQTHSESDREIMKRFASVFSLTFRRYQDLKKAEAQARESQIEAALERVRSRSMAMQKSEELKEVIQVVYEQFVHLDMQVEHTGFIMDYKERDDMHIWLADMHEVPSEISIPYFDSPHWNSFIEAKEKGIDFFANLLNFEEKNKFYHDLFQLISGVPDETKSYYLSCPALAGSTVLLDNVGLYIENFSGTPYTDEENKTLMRFGKVFQQTYTRFNDLQKAEAQVREAQIEAALEKVRSRSLAMHKSGELQEVVNTVFDRLMELEIKIDASSISIYDSEDPNGYWLWIQNADRTYSTRIYTPYYEQNNFGRDILAPLKNKKDLITGTYPKKEKDEWFNYMFAHSDFKHIPDSRKKFILSAGSISVSLAGTKNSGIMLIRYSDKSFSEKENEILKRFVKVFEQAYVRFLDLQKAETQALEAIKRSSVDRVRAEIASMRTTNDLERITPLIWNELTVLGIPFIRCGVFIMDEEEQKVQTFLYTEGKTIASFTSTFSNSKIITEALPYWRKKEIYKTHWDEAAFLEQAKSLVEQGAITTGEKYLTEHRPTDLYLHFLPFLQGMLYVGDAASLSEEHLELVQALADAFSTAYARYEDFNKLEAAKKQVDSTLNELQATQKQLIQSEKMASLGELTAGIAHEIQNPLNFVNNFSEVNSELIEEMKEEIEKGNLEEVKAIANDISENEQKINHHGKRADAIVKGMLQHSRSSTNVKEPTDINKLADEYLRLAYHGLRAKDKSFNATMKTDYDETIGSINIIPQDIGRVLLNLYTNAFYAVNEKLEAESSKLNAEYMPTVTVSTKKSGNQVFISVSDNGGGIPQKIIDKIFQPFFTTKPTGQGTGLGLSLSYDIIKAHGGEIKVETNEGEGTAFFIQLQKD